MAAVCREVQRIAEQQTPPVSGAGPYVDVDQQFRRMRETADTPGKLRTYIRQHAADIAAVRNR